MMPAGTVGTVESVIGPVGRDESLHCSLAHLSRENNTLYRNNFWEFDQMSLPFDE